MRWWAGEGPIDERRDLSDLRGEGPRARGGRRLVRGVWQETAGSGVADEGGTALAGGGRAAEGRVVQLVVGDPRFRGCVWPDQWVPRPDAVLGNGGGSRRGRSGGSGGGHGTAPVRSHRAARPPLSGDDLLGPEGTDGGEGSPGPRLPVSDSLEDESGVQGNH